LLHGESRCFIKELVAITADHVVAPQRLHNSEARYLPQYVVAVDIVLTGNETIGLD